MSVDRRTAIRQFLFISAGVALLPACLHDRSGQQLLPLKNMTVNGDQEALMAGLAAILIPGGQTPGAATVSAHLFVLKMMDECRTREQQRKFLKGIQQFDEACRTACGHHFAEANAAEQVALLTTIESKKMGGEELNYFYGEMKRLTIQAYTTSKYFLTRVHIYELVPGRWHGCVTVTPNKTT